MVEAIVASGIVVTAVASALTLVSGAVGAEKDSESLIVAGNLAREGMEVVRGMRDSNWLAGRDFDAGLSGLLEDHVAMPVFDPATNAWTLDFSPDDATEPETRVYRFDQASGAAGEGLMVQASTQPGGTTVTPWGRVVDIDPLCDTGTPPLTIAEDGSGCGTAKKVGIRVVSRVRWISGGRPHIVEMEERMLDWR